MVEKWWLSPWVAWPAGWVIGVLSGIAGNWAWERLRQKFRGTEEYLDFSCSGGIIRFEGQYKTTVSAQEIFEQISRVETPSSTDDTAPLSDTNSEEI